MILRPILKKSQSSSSSSNFSLLRTSKSLYCCSIASKIAQASPTKGVRIRSLQLVKPLPFSLSVHFCKCCAECWITSFLNCSIVYSSLFSMKKWSKYPLINISAVCRLPFYASIDDPDSMCLWVSKSLETLKLSPLNCISCSFFASGSRL